MATFKTSKKETLVIYVQSFLVSLTVYFPVFNQSISQVNKMRITLTRNNKSAIFIIGYDIDFSFEINSFFECFNQIYQLSNLSLTKKKISNFSFLSCSFTTESKMRFVANIDHRHWHLKLINSAKLFFLWTLTLPNSLSTCMN